MVSTELEEIKAYWSKKYPVIDIRLWANEDYSMFFCQMDSSFGNEHFRSETIGQLINLGEQFLRRVK